jgi:AraC-like DNA-binding protein
MSTMTTGTVSVRLLWPFLRVIQDFGPEIEVVRAAGVDPQLLSDPDERIPRRLLRDVIAAAVHRTGDVALGIHAGEKVESADFGAMDLASRACPDMRSAMQCIARYVRLYDDSIEMPVMEDGDRVLWLFRNAMPPVLNASNDFQVTVAFVNVLRHLGRLERPIEVHLRHRAPTDATEYERVFQAPICYGMPHNGLVFARNLLHQPVPSANPEAYQLFDVRASQMLEEFERSYTTSAKVRRLVAKRIGRESIGIGEVGAQLGISAATLRRRLVAEGTTYSVIVDSLRQELATQYLATRGVHIGEIACSLGFASEGAFGRAFRRWTGGSPSEHRARMNKASQRVR